MLREPFVPVAGALLRVSERDHADMIFQLQVGKVARVAPHQRSSHVSLAQHSGHWTSGARKLADSRYQGIRVTKQTCANASAPFLVPLHRRFNSAVASSSNRTGFVNAAGHARAGLSVVPTAHPASHLPAPVSLGVRSQQPTPVPRRVPGRRPAWPGFRSGFQYAFLCVKPQRRVSHRIFRSSPRLQFSM
jgi:hypothetical protein